MSIEYVYYMINIAVPHQAKNHSRPWTVSTNR